MKVVFIIIGFFLINSCFSQTKKTTKSNTTTKVNNASQTVSISKKTTEFKKMDSEDSLYMFSAYVMIENGHGELTKVLYKSSIIKKAWDDFISNNNYSDIEAFELVTTMLALNAKYKLKNIESFVPLPNQFFIWSINHEAFVSNFKMMGRNGYGNLSETTVLVVYDPKQKIKHSKNDDMREDKKNK